MKINSSGRPSTALLFKGGALLLALLLSFGVTKAQEAAPDPPPNVEATPTPTPAPVNWTAGSAVNPGRLVATLVTPPTPAPPPAQGVPTPTPKVTPVPATTSFPAGSLVKVEVVGASDSDHWVQIGAPTIFGDAPDTLTYSWRGGAAGTSSSMQVTMPATGNITVTCMVADTPTTVTAPDTGSRQDPAAAPLNLTLTVTPPSGGGQTPPPSTGPTPPPTTGPTPPPDTGPTPPPSTGPPPPPSTGPPPPPSGGGGGGTPTPSPSPTPSPISLTATAKDWHTINLSWNGSPGKLYRSTDPKFSPDDNSHIGRGNDETDPAKTSYSDGGLSQNTAYYYILVPSDPKFAQGRDNATTLKNSTNFSFSLGTTTLCAGGVTSMPPPDPSDPADAPPNPHETNVDITVKNEDGSLVKNTSVDLSVETTLPGSSSPLSMDNPNDVPNADLRAGLTATNATSSGYDSLTITTDDQGVAHATLISSKQIGATCVVKAKIGSDQDKSDAVTMKDADGDMSLDDESLPADGQSSTTVYRTMSSNDTPVYGHNVNFYIISVSDPNGNAVQPDGNGNFPGYGTITADQSSSDEYGITTAIFTAGTLPGTITFGSEDTTVVADVSGGSQLQSVSAQSQPSKRIGSRKKKGGSQSGANPQRALVNFNLIWIKGPSGVISTNTLTKDTAATRLNEIWNPSGIQFRKKWAYPHFNLQTDAVGAESQPGVIDPAWLPTIDAQFNRRAVVPKGTPRAGINVYFVRYFPSAILEGEAMSIPGHALMQRDGVGKDAGACLAHEIGHCMNERHTDNDGNNQAHDTSPTDTMNLMFHIIYGGTTITKQQGDIAVNQVNSDSAGYYVP